MQGEADDVFPGRTKQPIDFYISPLKSGVLLNDQICSVLCLYMFVCVCVCKADL